MSQKKESQPRPDNEKGMGGENRREFVKKMTYVAPVMITFVFGSESEAQGKGKGKGSPKPKGKKR